MITVCHVITRMILGGAQENTLYTVRGLHEDPGYEVDLVTGPALGPEGELVEEARSHGIDPILVDELRREIAPAMDWSAYRRLRDVLHAKPYDIVHTHSSKAGILARWAAREAGIPWIVHTIHGLPFHSYQPWYRYELFRQLERATASFTHMIQTVCDRMAEKAAEAGVHPTGSFRTIYSGMELNPFLEVPPLDSPAAHRRKDEWGYRPEHFVIGKIARLFRLKGHRYCMRAFRRIHERYPRTRLLLIGNGILRDDLEEMARSFDIRDRVQFAGLIPYRRIPSALAGMDCLVHLSLREGLPRVIPQAQAAGRPVISSAVDGAPEAVDDGRTGFLVPPKSVEPVVDALEELIQSSTLRRSFAREGRRWVQPRFDWRHMVQEIKRSYRTLFPEGDANPA